MLSKFKVVFILPLVLIIIAIYCSESMAKDWCGSNAITGFFGREYWHFNKNRQVLIKRGKRGKTVSAWRVCKKHDECYETLGSRRENCDKLYLNEMLRACEGALVGYSAKANNKCKKQARSNYNTISKYGEKAYQKKQQLARN